MDFKALIKRRKVQVGIGIVVIIIIIAMIAVYENTKIKIAFQLNDNVIEYGEDTAKIDWLKRSTTNGNQVTVKELDTKKIGEAEVVFTVCLEKTCEDFQLKVEIKDTKKPEIKLKKEKVKITEGTSFNPESNIESVKDPVDGDIAKGDDESLKENGYIIKSDIDNEKAGEYKVSVVAYDKHGNKTETGYVVTVKEKPKETIQSNTANYAQGTQSVNGGHTDSNGFNSGNAAQEQPHYRTDISSTYAAQINAYRQQNGLDALPITAEAQAEADRRAMELVSNYGHAASIKFSENIGMGTAGYDFFEAWKASPNHNGAMLEDSIFVAMAVSVVEYNGTWYAVTSFRCKDY